MTLPGVVVFDPAAFILRYPEFATVDPVLLNDYFTEATLYLDNTPCSQVRDLSQRSLLLNMLTAHIASLYSGTNGDPASPLVGRVNTATEGSVSVGTDLNGIPGTAQWYAQTKYGLSYWQATPRYRTMRYVPGSSSRPSDFVPRGYGYFGLYPWN